MPSLRDIRRRIASVKNTQQITSAMKMVSAAKLQRAQDRVMAARPYSEHLHQLIAQLDTRVQSRAHPLLTPREEGKTLLVVVTSDRGLCGGFNANVQRAAAELVRQRGGSVAVDVIAVGRKGRDFLTYRRIDLRTAYTDLFVRQVAYEQARELAVQLLQAYEQEGYREVLVIYNRFRSAIHQEVTTLRLLPLSAHTSAQAAPTEAFDYLYEPSPVQVLDSLLRREVEVQLLQIFLESFAGEHGLTLTFNRARQAAITKELIEVVSGADALQG